MRAGTRRGEPPAKHETLRVRLEELEKEIRMRVEQRRNCAAQYPGLLEENQLEDLRGVCCMAGSTVGVASFGPWFQNNSLSESDRPAEG